VIGELENRTELRFLKPLALGAWTYVSGSPTAKARESIALKARLNSVRGFHTPGRRVTVPSPSSNILSHLAISRARLIGSSDVPGTSALAPTATLFSNEALMGMERHADALLPSPDSLNARWDLAREQ
jgi:hypothetical protein